MRPREDDQPGSERGGMERNKRQRTAAGVEDAESLICGVGVKEAVEETIKIGKKEVRYGVVAAGGSTPFWNWVVPTGGVLCWCWGAEEDQKGVGTELGKLSGCAPNRRSARFETLDPVDVILFDGPGPRATSEFWKIGTVNWLAWVNGCSRCKPPACERSRWFLERLQIKHSELGGCTTVSSTFIVARRQRLMESPDPTDVASVGPKLSMQIKRGLLSPSCFRVINQVTPGRPCTAPDSKDVDLSSSLLQWEDRDLTFKLPSVFNNKASGFVRRKLTDKEVLTAMDLPAAVLKAASPTDHQKWRGELKVPFKSRFAIIRALGKCLVAAEGDAGSSGPSVVAPVKTKTPGIAEIGAAYFGSERQVGKGGLHVGPPIEPATITKFSLLKATKADGAEVAVWMWDSRCRAGCPNLEASVVRKNLDEAETNLAWSVFLTTVRRWMLRRWKRLVATDFWTWWRETRIRSPSQRLSKEGPIVAAGLAALHHSVDATWWDWDRGSAPFFWRFPTEWLVLIRDGLRPRFVSKPPKYIRAQRVPTDPLVKNLEREKLTTVRERGYLQPRTDIVGLLNFFSVPKGDSDVRMVYDGTKSGLNDSLYAPWFSLTSLDCMLRAVVPGTFSADNDYGEMFLNFWLHPDLRRYCGIDLTKLFPEEVSSQPGQDRLWESWTRCAMGLKPSPYQAVQTGLQLKQLAMGDRHSFENVFRWSGVRLNLPGDPSYDPTLPWVSKLREDGITVAADVLQFVDDLRVTGPSEEETWKASSQMAKAAAYRGCQDAARKRRPPALSPGAWAGSVVESTQCSVLKRVSQERWEKTQKCINEVSGWLNADTSSLPRKQLERHRGFLVYVSTTYSILTPYLRGIHLTLDSWRPNRDSEGWVDKNKDREQDYRLVASSLDTDDVEEEAEYPDAPATVRAVPRLVHDLAALHQLTRHDEPPNVMVRPVDGMAVVFIYGDASGAGYGISLWKKGAKEIGIEYGEWTKEYSEKSSNHREMYNFTLFLEKRLAQGDFAKGTEVFVFTDNQVTESAFYKGTSTSRQLFELVLRLRRLEMDGHLFLRVVWVAGTRMIEQGTDGFSRGDLENGVATGVDMLSYVPLNDTAFKRQANLEVWLRSSLQGSWITLDANGWYDEGMKAGQFIWCPAPAAADVALDQLCESKHIRPEGSHIFVCPALLTPRWRRKLGKIADYVFCVPVGSAVWANEQHEPVIVGLICPLLSSSPWQVRHCTAVLAQVSHGLPKVWSEDLTDERNCLRKFWSFARDNAEV